MAGTLKKLKKLRGRSLDELKVRGAQALAVYAERTGKSASARVPDDAEFFRLFDAAQPGGTRASAESLLEHFRTRTSPKFFPSFKNTKETLDEWKRRFDAKAQAALVERADGITNGRFHLLGLRDLSFGEPPDWHFEPLSNRRTPLAHWSRIDYLNAEVAGDKKIIWELNRHQYFMTLGRAYRLTGDERYARTFSQHLDAWMEANPPKLGINWASSLEVAFRSISWLWAFYFFKDSTHLSPPLFLRALKFLHLHARHLETYPSTYFSPNTHLTGEALGLFYLGTLLPELREAARWRERGKQILLEQLPRHVRADGVYFEQSSYYHRYTTDFYTHLLILSRANGDDDGGEVETHLVKLLDHLMHITRPDGTTPLFGDDDGGRLSPLDERAADDFRSTLSNGAALFARPDYKFVAGSLAEETLWLGGIEGVRAFDSLEGRPPAEHARAFEAGGYYSMRDRWTSDADYLLVDCGPHGSASPAHAHADALSFEFAAGGRTLLVDSGTYTYTGAAEMRDYFRSSEAHNTLVIDGESSSVSGGAFAWKQVAQSRARRWSSCRRFSYFEGTHDGYERFAATQAATHTRSIFFLGGDYVAVRDHVETAGEHQYDLYFHFAPDADPAIENGSGDEGINAVHEHGARGLSLYAFGAGGEWRRETNWVSTAYGERTLAPVCVYRAQGRGAQEFYTFLVTQREAQPRQRSVREIALEDGRAFRIESQDRRDLLLVKSAQLMDNAGAALKTDGCASDFEWTWMRSDAGDSALMEWVLIGGSSFVFRERVVFGASGRVGYAAARCVDEQLFVETDARVAFSVALGGARCVVAGGRSFEVGEASSVAFDVGAGGAYEISGIERAAFVAGADLAASDAAALESGGAREEIYVRD